MKFVMSFVVLLSGCAAFGPPQGMSADQLKAYAQDKNSSAVCWTVLGPGWTSKVMAINLDETRYTGGSVTVTPDCAATITSEVQPKTPVAPAVTPVAPAPKVTP